MDTRTRALGRLSFSLLRSSLWFALHFSASCFIVRLALLSLSLSRSSFIVSELGSLRLLSLSLSLSRFPPFLRSLKKSPCCSSWCWDMVSLFFVLSLFHALARSLLGVVRAKRKERRETQGRFPARARAVFFFEVDSYV